MYMSDFDLLYFRILSYWNAVVVACSFCGIRDFRTLHLFIYIKKRQLFRDLRVNSSFPREVADIR